MGTRKQILSLLAVAGILISASFFVNSFLFNEEQVAASSKSHWITKVGDAYVVPACASSGGTGGGTGDSTGGTGGTPTQDAEYISQSVPTTMLAGTSRAVSVTMRNCRPNGDCSNLNTWSQSGLYKLGSQNPQDNGRWGLYRVNLPASSVAPGSSATFNFSIRAPTTPGTYNFQWRMLQEGVTWFGEFTPNVPINVIASGFIAGRFFHDLNGDGNWDAGEPLLKDPANSCSGSSLDNLFARRVSGPGFFNMEATRCNLDGPYYITDRIPAGSYVVEAGLPSGWIRTTPNITTTVTNGNVAIAWFGVARPGAITGRVFNDLNGDGTFDAGEPYVLDAGVPVCAGGTNMNLDGVFVRRVSGETAFASVEPRLCNSGGAFYSTGSTLRPGPYTVGLTPPAGWVRTTPDATTNVSSGGVGSAWFGIKQAPGSIIGRVFHDLNGDGVRQAGETTYVLDVGFTCANGTNIKLDGAQIFRASGPTVFDPVEPQSCNSGGAFYSTGNILSPGTYTVGFIAPSGWRRTSVGNITTNVDPGVAGLPNPWFGIEPIPGFSDLTSSINALPAITAGQAVTFSGRVTNGGTASAGAFATRFCIDNPSCLTSSAGQVGAPTVGSLAAGATTANLNSNSWAATVGSHTLYFCADTGGAIAESSESNNCDNQAFTVSAGPTADLTASPPFIFEGETSNLNWSCTNSVSATIDQGIGSLVCSSTTFCNGSVQVSPIETTLYTLTCTGAGTATDDDKATIQVGKIIES